jgi:hypothetical protein
MIETKYWLIDQLILTNRCPFNKGLYIHHSGISTVLFLYLRMEWRES